MHDGCPGTWMIHSRVKSQKHTLQDIDEEEGVRAVHEAFRLGINYFDTSPFYGGTRSEQVSPCGGMAALAKSTCWRCRKCLPRHSPAAAAAAAAAGYITETRQPCILCRCWAGH